MVRLNEIETAFMIFFAVLILLLIRLPSDYYKLALLGLWFGLSFVFVSFLDMNKLKGWLRLNKELLICLNILTLLKTGAKTSNELWMSGHFKTRFDMERGLHTLLYSNCIEKLHFGKPKVYCILGNGLKMLEQYPNWIPGYNEIVVPIGGKDGH